VVRVEGQTDRLNAIKRAGVNRWLDLPESVQPDLWDKVHRPEEIGFGLENLGLPRADMEARIDEMLRLLGIEELADRSPLALSGGQMAASCNCLSAGNAAKDSGAG